jgi:hypothetical protein
MAIKISTPDFTKTASATPNQLMQEPLTVLEAKRQAGPQEVRLRPIH